MRSLRLFACLIAGPTVTIAARAQEADTTHHSANVHHDAVRPDYVRFVGFPNVNPIRLPPPPVGEPPAVVRGIYLNAWVFGGARFHNLVRLADSTEINTFVIDVKDDTGFLTYRSTVATAIEIGANNMIRSRNVRERLAVLEEHGIHPVARIVVAKDPLLAKHKSSWAIHDTEGGLWRDRQGNEWVDAYRDSVWLYAAQIAEEAVLLGFSEIQLDYVRFPDEPRALLDRAIFPARVNGESRRRAVRRNLSLVRDRVRALGVPFTIDVFGLVTSARSDMGIGQVWEDVIAIADVVLPMVYPSHYYRGAYGHRRPNSEPYAIVRQALEDGIRRLANVPQPGSIRPYLQSFTLGRPRYTASEVRAQIDAVHDLGLTDWVLWNASGRYPPGAFRSARLPAGAPAMERGSRKPDGGLD